MPCDVSMLHEIQKQKIFQIDNEHKMNDSSILFFFIQLHTLLILIKFPYSPVESSSQYLI